jgi:hypothetical protein
LKKVHGVSNSDKKKFYSKLLKTFGERQTHNVLPLIATVIYLGVILGAIDSLVRLGNPQLEKLSALREFIKLESFFVICNVASIALFLSVKAVVSRMRRRFWISLMLTENKAHMDALSKHFFDAYFLQIAVINFSGAGYIYF